MINIEDIFKELWRYLKVVIFILFKLCYRISYILYDFYIICKVGVSDFYCVLELFGYVRWGGLLSKNVYFCELFLKI